MGNCDKWYTVDFGRGSVEVRCTQTGTHAQCRTEVFHRDVGVVPERVNVFSNNFTHDQSE